MPAVLPVQFARRMLPLAILAAAALAVIPPLAYGLIVWHRLTATATAHAVQLGQAYGMASTRLPRLWIYNAEKVARTTLGAALADVGHVELTDCHGRALAVDAASVVGARGRGGPAAWAAIVAHGREIAGVRVEMDPRHSFARWIPLAGGSLLLGVAFGLALFLFPTRVVRLQSARLAESNRDLTQKVAAAVAEVRSLSERVIGVQESERSRIARDLHDGLGQSLTALQLALEVARSRSVDEGDRLGECIRACEEALREVRRVVHDLHPPELAASDLAEVLRATTERFERRTGIAASFRHSGAAVESPEVRVALLRVLQEALTNVARHGQAREVGVALASSEEEVLFEIVDDGVGFVPEAPHEGSGLRGIRERCAFLGGRLEIESRPGGGTRLRIRLGRPGSPA